MRYRVKELTMIDDQKFLPEERPFLTTSVTLFWPQNLYKEHCFGKNSNAAHHQLLTLIYFHFVNKMDTASLCKQSEGHLFTFGEGVITY